MSSTMKISLLALASTVIAVPHYGAHSKFHSLKPSGARGTGYPTGSWSGEYNSTGVPYPTDKTSTIDSTSTSTQTVYSTVIVKASASGVEATSVAVENVSSVKKVSSGECGPATVTVTASEKVTVTVTPSSGSAYTAAPLSSVVSVGSKNATGASTSSSAASFALLSSATPAAAKSTTPVAEYSAATSKASTTSAVATPEAAKSTSSSAAAYVAASYAQNVVSSVAVSASATSAAASASVKSASASASSTASTSNTYSGTKRGLAYNEASLCSTLGSKFGFGYNWGQTESNDIGTNFIPMMHTPTDSTAAAWLANVDAAVKKGSTAVMGFNECDIATQCNMEPAAACTAWMSYMNPIKSAHSDVTIIGPSVSNSGTSGQGLSWLKSFHTACPGALIDATNIHFYDIYEVDSTLERFKTQVESAAAILGNKVWVTEFGLNTGSATTDQAVTFLKAAMEYLDSSDVVQGYSWFMVGTGENQLNTASGLSTIGEAYAA